MTPEAAIQSFFERFGVPAYAAASVPETITFPYLTYTLSTGDFYGGEIAITADLWTLGSEAEINAMARRIGEEAGRGGVMLSCDGGAVWLKKGSPFAVAVTEEAPVRRRALNFDAEYLLT